MSVFHRVPRIVHQWINGTLYHHHEYWYEYVSCGQLEGYKIMVSTDEEAKEECRVIEWNQKKLRDLESDE